MTSPARRLRALDRAPVALHDRAMDNLRYIRETMERSASFTHVSGAGWVMMGLTALVASAVTWNGPDPTRWLLVWIVAAAISVALAVYMMARKSRADGMTLLTGPGRKFAWNVIPPFGAGAVLTLVFARADLVPLLPGVWLMLYGTGVVTGGSHSVKPVPVMGVVFMLVGIVALLTPVGWGNHFMAGGFGGLHIVFGALIWRKHGG
jgi:hypothetical protein